MKAFDWIEKKKFFIHSFLQNDLISGNILSDFFRWSKFELFKFLFLLTTGFPEKFYSFFFSKKVEGEGYLNLSTALKQTPFYIIPEKFFEIFTHNFFFHKKEYFFISYYIEFNSARKFNIFRIFEKKKGLVFEILVNSLKKKSLGFTQKILKGKDSSFIGFFLNLTPVFFYELPLKASFLFFFLQKFIKTCFINFSSDRISSLSPQLKPMQFEIPRIFFDFSSLMVLLQSIEINKKANFFPIFFCAIKEGGQFENKYSFLVHPLIISIKKKFMASVFW